MSFFYARRLFYNQFLIKMKNNDFYLVTLENNMILKIHNLSTITYIVILNLFILIIYSQSVTVCRTDL